MKSEIACPAPRYGTSCSVYPGARLKEFEHEIGNGADAGNRYRDAAWLSSRERDHLGGGRGGKASACCKNYGVARDRGHGGEITLRVVGQIAAQTRIDRDSASSGEEQRVTVGRGLRDVIGPDRAVRAGLVLDDDALAEVFLQFVGDEAGDEIGVAARCEGDDEPDRALRIVLSAHRARERKHKGCDRDDCEPDPGSRQLGFPSTGRPARRRPCFRRRKEGSPCRHPALIHAPRSIVIAGGCTPFPRQTGPTSPDQTPG